MSSIQDSNVLVIYNQYTTEDGRVHFSGWWNRTPFEFVHHLFNEISTFSLRPFVDGKYHTLPDQLTIDEQRYICEACYKMKVNDYIERIQTYTKMLSYYNDRIDEMKGTLLEGYKGVG